MLNELKEELEYCRRKWNLAREKNDESQIQWESLRREFSARKLADSGSQNSAESGFSDDDECSEEATQSKVPFDTIEAPVIVCQPVLLYTAADASDSELASGSGSNSKDLHPQLSRELRKKKVKKVKTKSGAETLEDMFYRISGTEPPEESSSESEEEDELFEEQPQELGTLMAIPEEIITFTEETETHTPESDHEAMSDYVDPEDEERRQRRAERFQRLEDQCAQLINQVMKTATRGNELNKQLDDVHNRYRTPTRDANAPTISSPDACNEGASTSSATAESVDTAGLTEREQEFTSRRAARLKRLEEECKAFLNKVNATNTRATDLNTKIDNLHEHHSSRLAERASLVKSTSTEVVETSSEVPETNISQETDAAIDNHQPINPSELNDNIDIVIDSVISNPSKEVDTECSSTSHIDNLIDNNQPASQPEVAENYDSSPHVPTADTEQDPHQPDPSDLNPAPETPTQNNDEPNDG